MLLGIDLGTSALKATLYSSDGAEQRAAAVAYPTRRRGVTEEQDPRDWVEALRQALTEVLPAGQPVAIGITGQMSGLLPLDDLGLPVAPFLPWSDRRAEDGAEALLQRFGPSVLYSRTGCRPSPSYPAARLWWMRKHQPELWAQVRSLVGAREYLVMRLTGEMVTDPSGAGATQLFDIHRGLWWQPMLEFLELSARLPPVELPWERAGHTIGWARSLGLSESIPVAVGAGDGPCSSWGAGATRSGDVVISIGTSGVVRSFAEGPLLHPEAATTCYPLGQGLYAGTGVTSTAGAALEWVANLIGLTSVDDLQEIALTVPAGSAGLTFVPDLGGARTPFWDPRARGSFTGMELSHTRAHLARAAIEGVALSLYLALEALEQAGARPTRVLLTGGGSRNLLLAATLAGLTGLHTYVADGGDATLGAAQLAAVTAAIYPDLSTARKAMSPRLMPVAPTALPSCAVDQYRTVAFPMSGSFKE